METIDFNGSTLYFSLRSPFARRVRVAFIESGIQFNEEVRDVWKPNPDLTAINPLHRVPTLKLSSGDVLTESSMILDLFYRFGERPIAYRNPREWVTGFHWSGIAVGMIEKTVERFIETLRPESGRDPEIMADLPGVVERVLTRLEKETASKTFMVGGRMTQADIDLASALTYLEFRYDKKALEHCPNLRQYLGSLESRPSFARTRPEG